MKKSQKLVKKCNKNVNLDDKSNKNVNLDDKKPQTSEKKTQKCEFM